MSKIHWLHVSDIHLNKRDVDTRRMRNNLLEYISGLGTQIDYIFLTGDLRYAPSGKFAADTVEYINKLLNAAKLTVDRLFIVPGNHDIERDADGRSDAILESIKDYSPKDGAFPSDKMSDMHNGHAKFREMIHAIYRDNLERAAYYDDDRKPHFVIETKDFNIICIDTALTYTRQRNDKLIIGTECIMDLFEKLNQNKPSIILTHYSSDFLERSEQMQMVQLLKDFHVQLWLAGHEHTSFMRKQWDYFYEFQCGNLMHEGEYTKSTIMIGTYDSVSYGGIVEVHEWDSDNGWFKMQNIGLHKEDYYSYELQNAKTMIDQIANISHQKEESPVPMEDLPAIPADLSMSAFCGENLSDAFDVHQMPCETSSGYLYTNNNIAPTAKVDIIAYNLYGAKYYEIQNDGFRFTFMDTQSLGNISFGYELSRYTDVEDRLYWFQIISEIVNAATIRIKFGSSANTRSLRLFIPGAGSSFDQVREDTALWKDSMERIAKIENYYGVKFYLPRKVDASVYVTIGILSDSIDRLPVRRLPIVHMKSRGFFKHFTLKEEVWYGNGTDLVELTLFGYTFKPIGEYILPGEFYWNRKEHGWESDKENGGVSVRVEFVIDNDVTKEKKLLDVIPVSELGDSVNLDEIPIIREEQADFLAGYMNLTHKVQGIYRQYQMYQKALGEWIHYDLNEEHHLVKKYSGAVIDKVTVNKMTKSILQEGVMLVTKADDIITTLGLQSESEFLKNAVADSLGFQFMVFASAYAEKGQWAVSIEGGECFYNLLEMCTTLRTVGGEEDSAELLKALLLLKDEWEAQNMDVSHIDHYDMMRNFIYTVANIYKTFFNVIQKKLEDVAAKVDSFLEEHPDFIVQSGKYKGYVFYQADHRNDNVDAFDTTGNIMNDFFVFKSEAARNYERALEGIKNPEDIM